MIISAICVCVYTKANFPHSFIPPKNVKNNGLNNPLKIYRLFNLIQLLRLK